MGEVVNLRQARKAHARKAKDVEAAANRAAHGVAKADRRHAQAETARDVRRLDAHRRDTVATATVPGAPRDEP